MNMTKIPNSHTREDIIREVGDRRNLTILLSNYKEMFPTLNGDVAKITESFYTTLKHTSAFDLEPEVRVQEINNGLFICFVFDEQDTIVEMSKILHASSIACKMITRVMGMGAHATTIQLLAQEMNKAK